MKTDVRTAIASIMEARATVAAAVDSEREVLMSTLRARREEAGLTQTAIADAIGLSRTQVTNIEADRGASLDAVIAYAGALGYRLTLTEVRMEHDPSLCTSDGCLCLCENCRTH